jgi:hypothetical protein
VATDALLTCLLLIHTSSPRLRQRMGGAFFPLALIVKAAILTLSFYVSLFAFIPRGLWEQFGLASLMRLSMHATLLTIFIAWQYEVAWAINRAQRCDRLPGSKGRCILYALYGRHQRSVSRDHRRRPGRRPAYAEPAPQAAELEERNRKLAHYASTVE